MTDFTTDKRRKLAGSAGRGDKRALETLLRDLVDSYDGLSSTELGFLDGVTAGTVTASKALVVDASSVLDELTVTTLKSEVTAGSTATNITNTGVTTLSSTGGLAYTMDAPEAGTRAVLTCTAGSSVNTHTVTLASGTFDGTNHIATFDAAAETLVVDGLSTSAFCVSSNVGSVALSTQ